METLPKSLNESIKNIIIDKKITNESVKVHLIPSTGKRFMGVYRHVTITGVINQREETINLFIKTMRPEIEVTIYSVPGVFAKETTMYGDIFRVGHELQEEARIPFDQRYNIPKYYKAVTHEHIILNNLARQGYNMFDKLDVPLVEFAELCMQQLGRLHGLGFVLQAKRPVFFEAKVKTLQQPYVYGTEKWNEFVGNLSRKVLPILKPEVAKKVEAYIDTTYDKYRKYTTDPDSVRTIVHNDFRGANVMAKVNPDSNEITGVMVIDFQQTFYGCPIIDFLYFIFSETDQDFRREHLTNLKSLYHNSMEKFLSYFNLDINEYYSKEMFEKMYKKRLDYGLMVSLWLLPTILSDSDEMPDVSKLSRGEGNEDFSETVKSRVRGVVDDFIKWGYL